MEYKAITETNSHSVDGFVTLLKATHEAWWDAYCENFGPCFDGGDICERNIGYIESLDERFNGHLPCQWCEPGCCGQ